MGKTVLTAFMQRFDHRQGSAITIPGPEIQKTLPPRSLDLVNDYIRHVGGDPGMYKKELPPHLFPQWAFGLASQTLCGVPYPLMKVMNGGCRIEVNHPLPNNEPLQITARLEDVNDNGKRAVLHQKIITGTASTPNALTAHLYAIVPLPHKKEEGGKKSEPARVPKNVREIGFWKLSAHAGLDFAKLTGDFNPIHWIPSYARASGFKSTILHGFGTMARAMEGVNRICGADGRKIKVFDVKFTRPLVLPAKVGLFVTEKNEVFVGDAPGGPAYLTGHFEMQ
ncbi:MAG: hypothetical protein HQM11_17090 [SAR324 cluster bacterium]|nr:hypothetical protein [SAR324 cluster bacterium]